MMTTGLESFDLGLLLLLRLGQSGAHELKTPPLA